MFEEWAARRPDHPAVCGADGAVLTYRDLNRQANRVARRLIDAGVAPDVRVPVLADRGSELVVGWLAVQKASGAYVPIDTSAPRARIGELVAEVATTAATVVTLALTSENLDDRALTKLDDENPPQRAGPGHLAYVTYSSGSTGRPQGCEVERSSLAHLLRWYRAEAGITPDDRLLQAVSPGFDAAVLEIWVALCSGATLCFVPTMLTEPGQLLCWMAEHQVTVAFLPTPLAEVMLTDCAWPDGLRLRVLCTGGDQLEVRGQRVEPAEAERALTAHPLVREAVVVASLAPSGSARLAAHAADVPGVPDAAGVPDAEELITWTADLLPRHTVPSEIVA